MHRDYHSRNLMVSTPNPGVLDFQDAVCGPGHLRSRLAPARRLHRVGRGAADRLGGALLGARARGRPPGRRRFRRVLARLRMDGRAATAQGARHLRATRAPRRQARLSRRHAARDGAICAAPARATARCIRCSRSSTSSTTARLPSATRSRDRHDALRDDPGRRPRRADASAVRRDAETVARGGRQAAHRLADRSSRACRLHEHRDQCGASRRQAHRQRSAMAAHSASAFAGRSRPSRSRRVVASQPRCRCCRGDRC